MVEDRGDAGDEFGCGMFFALCGSLWLFVLVMAGKWLGWW